MLLLVQLGDEVLQPVLMLTQTQLSQSTALTAAHHLDLHSSRLVLRVAFG